MEENSIFSSKPPALWVVTEEYLNSPDVDMMRQAIMHIEAVLYEEGLEREPIPFETQVKICALWMDADTDVQKILDDMKRIQEWRETLGNPIKHLGATD